MINKIVRYALKKRLLILVMALVLAVGGVIAFKELPIEAYPDIADTWVQIISQWTGHAAEEVETQVTIPMEIAMTGVPRTKIRLVAYMAQMKSGSRNHVMPGARILWIVTIKFSPVRIEEKPAMKTPSATRVTLVAE